MKLFNNRKGQTSSVSALIPLGITLVVLAIVLSLGQQILGDFMEDTKTATCNWDNGTTTGCGYDANGTEQGRLGVDNIATKQGLIATVVVAGVLIAIVVGAFALSRRS